MKTEPNRNPIFRDFRLSVVLYLIISQVIRLHPV